MLIYFFRWLLSARHQSTLSIYMHLIVTPASIPAMSRGPERIKSHGNRMNGSGTIRGTG